MTDPLHPRDHFSAMQWPLPAGGGVAVSERAELGIASILARKDARGTLAARIRGAYGIDPPDGPRRVTSGDVSLVGVGPGAWLAVRERGGNAFAESLGRAVQGVASVCDQSDAYAVLRLAGPEVREALCKIVPVDLHPVAFKVGGAASTLAGHIGVILWRLEDSSGGPVFELLAYRSYAANLWHALAEAAAEFRCPD